MSKTFIIAEAGANHDRNFEQACKLIDVAVEAKANAVKFQTYSANTLYCKNTPNFAGYENVFDLIKNIELPREWQIDLKKYCDDKNVEFMSTPFDKKAVDELYNLGVKRFKIAGFECTDPRMVKYVASTKLPLVISLGIGTKLETATHIRNWILEVNKEPDITFLHCNNAYPTPYEDINLGQMKKMIKHFHATDLKFGLSDHTQGILVPPLAVVMGAKVIEKHYTIDKTLPGPDHPFAIEPEELKEMIKNIRLAEKALGEKTEKYTESEQNFSMARRSVVTNCDIRPGDLITEENITTKRPLLDDSIPAIEYYNLIGKRFSKNLSEDTLLKWGDISE